MRKLINRLAKRLTWDTLIGFIVGLLITILTALGFTGGNEVIRKVGDVLQDEISDTTKVFHNDVLIKNED